MKGRSPLFYAAMAVALAVSPARAQGPVSAVQTQVDGPAREASLDGYRKHLLDLAVLVEACAKARDAKACDPALVGPDDRVALAEGSTADVRLVRYEWLRALFLEAQEKDKDAGGQKNNTAAGSQSKPEGGKSETEAELPVPPTTAELLKDAGTRLAHDLVQADKAATANDRHAQEREALKQVLAGREFRNLAERTVRDTAWEKFGDWLNRLIESAARLRSRSAWIGRAIVGGFILVVCTGLIWGLLKLERRWRVRLMPEDEQPAAGSASARDWQLWLDEARKSASVGAWREAVHGFYWAAISRLESKRLWPTDRARTLREYLALLAAEEPRRAGLTTLTRSFERSWYGGRPASESEYRQAERLAEGLISGGKAPGGDAK